MWPPKTIADLVNDALATNMKSLDIPHWLGTILETVPNVVENSFVKIIPTYKARCAQNGNPTVNIFVDSINLAPLQNNGIKSKVESVFS